MCDGSMRRHEAKFKGPVWTGWPCAWKRCVALVVLSVAVLVPGAGAEGDSKLWFPVGEILRYKLYWGILPVGRAEISTEWVERDGQRLIRIHGTAKSNRLIAMIYPVDDVVESLVDPETFVPVEFKKIQNEGRLHRDERTVFDRENLVAHLTGEQTRKGRHREHDRFYPIDEDTRDVLTFMYFLRGIDPEEKEDSVYRVMTGEKVYELHIGDSTVEEVKVGRYGRVKCREYRPRAALEAVFVQEGELWMWVSEDERQILVSAKAKGRIFSTVRAELDEVKGPGDDFWVRP